jgi:signal transduction histidine kinase
VKVESEVGKGATFRVWLPSDKAREVSAFKKTDDQSVR